jgi:hypothetical protein
VAGAHPASLSLSTPPKNLSRRHTGHPSNTRYQRERSHLWRRGWPGSGARAARARTRAAAGGCRTSGAVLGAASPAPAAAAPAAGEEEGRRGGGSARRAPAAGRRGCAWPTL